MVLKTFLTFLDYNFYAEESYVERDIIEGNHLVTRTKGIFVPNIDANYVFSVFADDQMEFYLNSNGTDPNDAVRYRHN